MLNLPAWREANNHTQESLAKALAVAVRTIRRWEAGQTAPPEDLAAKLVAVASVPAKHKAPEILKPKTHPALFERYSVGRRVYNTYSAIHPFYLFSPEELTFYCDPTPGSKATLATVLEDPLYIQRRDAIKAALALKGPAKPRLSDEEFNAKAAAGASFEELFGKKV